MSTTEVALGGDQPSERSLSIFRETNGLELRFISMNLDHSLAELKLSWIRQHR